MRDMIDWLRAQLVADERTLLRDERHWSEVPDQVLSRDFMLADLRAKWRILDFLERASDPDWATYAVASEAKAAVRGWLCAYSDRDGYRQEWAS